MIGRLDPIRGRWEPFFATRDDEAFDLSKGRPPATGH
jgi:hypothetical protein